LPLVSKPQKTYWFFLNSPFSKQKLKVEV